MSANGGVIDVDLIINNKYEQGLRKFESDSKQSGESAGNKLREEFERKPAMAKLKTQADEAGVKDFKKLLDSLPKDKQTELLAKANKGEAINFKKVISEIPKDHTTEIVAQAKEAGIDNFEKLLKRLPKDKRVELFAKAEKGEAINFEKLLREIPAKKVSTIELNDNATSGLHSIKEQAEQVTDRFSKLKQIAIGTFLGSTIASGVRTVTGFISGLGQEALNSSDALDKFKSTMQLGGFDNKEIDEARKKVKKYADDTVYDLNTVSNTTAQLAANGIKDYTGLTEAAGNLNAQAGGNAETFKSVAMVMTQTAGAGKLTTENWNQLADAIPGASGVLQKAMKENGAFTGKFRDAMENGQISADEFNDALIKLGSNDAAKKAATSTSTFEGAWGSLEANVVSGLDKIIDKIGKNHLTGIINSLSGVATKSFDALATGVSKVVDYIDKHQSSIKGIVGSFKTIAGIIGATVWKTFSSIVYDIADMFGLVDKKGKQASDPLKTIDDVLKNIANHKEAIENVTKAILAFMAIKKAAEFIGMLKGVNQQLKIMEGFSAISGLFGGGKGGKVASGANLAGDVAMSGIGKSGKVGGLLKGLAGGVGRRLPLIGAGVGAALELQGMTSKTAGRHIGGAAGAFGGTMGGAAAGAAIGSVVPGIGTGIGALVGGSLGAIGGTSIGKKIGGDIQKGIKSNMPGMKTLAMDIGQSFSDANHGAFKKRTNANMKDLSKSYTGFTKQLNKSAVIKFSVNGKSVKDAKKQTDDLYTYMSKKINGFYKTKGKQSEDDIKLLVKNGVLSKKEGDKILKDSQTKNKKEEKSQQDLLKVMHNRTNKYYSDVEKVQSGKTKKLEEIAKKYGTHSKQYESERQKELNKLRSRYDTQLQKDETKLNDKVTATTKIASGKQLNILQDLKSHKGKISHEQMTKAIQDSKKERDTIIDDAKKQRNKAVEHANNKYKDTVKAADRERYENGTMSKKQYDQVIENAKKERDDAISAADKRKNKSIEKATETHHKVVEQATKQAGEHKGAVDGETGQVIGSWKEFVSNTAGVFNSITGGVNYILNAMHKGWGKIPKWTPKGYATGTKGLLQDETALVGEEGFELAHHPNKGIFALGTQGPEITHLSAGTSILPHNMSKEFLSMTSKLPAHKDGVLGTLSDAFDWTKKKAGQAGNAAVKAADWVGDKVGDGYNYVKDKAKDIASFISKGASGVWDDFSNKFGLSKLLNGEGGQFDITKGALGMAKDKIVGMMSDFFDQFTEDNGDATGSVGDFMKLVTSQKGKPYVWGATGPSSFDCSGLVMWALGKMGISFPHFTGTQYGATQHIGKNQAKTGDLVFFGENASQHVGIVAGKNRMFNARNPSDGIGYDAISAWSEPVWGYGRIRQIQGGGGSSAKPSGGHANWLTQAGIHGNFDKWNYIINHESSWNPQAKNPSSDAYGIGQALPPSKMAKFGGDYMTNPITQLKWMKSYVNERYGGIDGAYDFWKSHNWYANGGWANKPSIFGEVKGEPEIAINPARNTADEHIKEVIAVRAKKAPNSLSARLDRVVQKAKTGINNAMPNMNISRGSGNVATLADGTQINLNGNLTATFEVDGNEVARKTFPFIKLMQSNDVGNIGIRTGNVSDVQR